MPGGLDGDDNVGMEVIKESFGMTDADLAPETEALDWGDGDTGDETDGSEQESSAERAPQQERE
jgi:hypothetical protein